MTLNQYDATWRYNCPKNNGMMLPWYTEGALKWLLQQDYANWSVLEIGCGYSSVWYKANVIVWEGFDSNKEWAKGLDAYYCEYISGFDLICIDSENRYECLVMALNSDCKYIIVDNWMQPSVEIDWKDAEELIKKYKYEVHKQPNHDDWQTLIIIK